MKISLHKAMHFTFIIKVFKLSEIVIFDVGPVGVSCRGKPAGEHQQACYHKERFHHTRKYTAMEKKTLFAVSIGTPPPPKKKKYICIISYHYSNNSILKHHGLLLQAPKSRVNIKMRPAIIMKIVLVDPTLLHISLEGLKYVLHIVHIINILLRPDHND